MPTGDSSTDPGRPPASIEVRARSLETVAADLGKLRGALRAHAFEVQTRRAEDDARAVQVQEALDSLAHRLATLEAGTTRAGAAPSRAPERDALKEQDRRLLLLRIVLVLIPTIAALAAPWLSARDVVVPPEAVQAIEAAVRSELAPPGEPVEEPAAFGPEPPPGPQ